MSNVNCLDLIKGNEKLEKHFESITDLSNVEQRAKAVELAKEYYKGLHNELEGFKKKLNPEYKSKKFVPENTDAKVAAVKEKYAPKPTPTVSEPTQPKIDALKDVESTAKALEEIDSRFVKPKEIDSEGFKSLMQQYEKEGLSKEDAFNRVLVEEKKVKSIKSPISTILSTKAISKELISIPDPKGGYTTLPRVLIRFGEPIVNENGEYQKSGIYINGVLNGNEKGISVYEVGYDPISKKYILPNDELSNETQGSLMVGKGRDVFIIEGKELRDLGSDGEVLIEPKTYKSISKINKEDITGDVSGDFDESVKYWKVTDSQKLSYLYHKAKKDGTNPELVKAVEDVLGTTQSTNKPTQPITAEPTPKVKTGVTEEKYLEEYAKDVGEAAQVYNWVSDTIKSTPDITVDEIMDAISEDAPQLLEGERRTETEALVRGLVEGAVPPSVPNTPQGVGFAYEPNKDKRVAGLMEHIQKATKIDAETKQKFLDNGIEYNVSNSAEAENVANGIVSTLSTMDVLQIARGVDMHPSVRSAIYASLINKFVKEEADAKKAGNGVERLSAAKMWVDISTEYSSQLTGSGQFSAYASHFYKTSPLGFVLRENKNRSSRIDDFLQGKEADYEAVFNALKNTPEGSDLLRKEVEALRREERKNERKKKYKKIDDFFDQALKDISGGNYATIPFAPQALKLVLETAKASAKACVLIADIIDTAIAELDKLANGKQYDKDLIKAYLEKGLSDAIGNESVIDTETLLKNKTAELKRRIDESDFSAEAYRDKKTLTEKEQAAKEEYDETKKLYDEAKKKSEEWIDKKSKQYLAQLSKKLKGLTGEQKEDVIRRSFKKIIENGGLKMDEFKDIVADVIGIKKLTDEDIVRVEGLMAAINNTELVEAEMVKNPTPENIRKYEETVKLALEAHMQLNTLISSNSDIVKTMKSMITGSLLGVPTLIKNVFQNAIFQVTVRFPRSLILQAGQWGVYAASLAANKVFGSKVLNPTSNLMLAQKGYFGKGLMGVKRGAFNFVKGTVEPDVFGKTEYKSTLSPKTAAKELKLAKAGELYLTNKEKWDRRIRASIFGRQADFILRGMQFGDVPQRWGAEGGKGFEIARQELGIVDDMEMQAFLYSPELYAKKSLMKSGKSEAEASDLAKEIKDRIVLSGEKAVLQDKNLLSMVSDYAEKGLQKTKGESGFISAAKSTGSILKTLTFPFVKIPANAYWVMFKIANPALTMAYSVAQYGMSIKYSKRGEYGKSAKYREQGAENASLAMLGVVISLLAKSMVDAGLVRGGNDDEEKKRKSAGEKVFGKQNQVNIGKIFGGSDYWADLSWLGPLGSVLDIQSRKREAALNRDESEDFGEIDDMLETMGYSATSSLNSLVFDNGAKAVDAIRGGVNPLKYWFISTMNTAQNVITGATYTAISKAMLPEQPVLKADDLLTEIANNVKQRNAIVRLFAGRPPSRVSMWGEPIKIDNSVTGVIGGVLGFEKGSQDIFGVILYDEVQKTGDGDFFPPAVYSTLQVGKEDFKLSTSEHERLQVLVGQERKKMVAPFINGAVWERDKDGDYKTWNQMKDKESKIKALKRIYDDARETAVEQFKIEYPKYSKEK